jgi:hypothetical protein
MEAAQTELDQSMQNEKASMPLRSAIKLDWLRRRRCQLMSVNDKRFRTPDTSLELVLELVRADHGI